MHDVQRKMLDSKQVKATIVRIMPRIIHQPLAGALFFEFQSVTTPALVCVQKSAAKNALPAAYGRFLIAISQVTRVAGPLTGAVHARRRILHLMQATGSGPSRQSS